MIERLGRTGSARLFEPDDRLVGARLQQMHHSDSTVPGADIGVAGTKPYGLLHERGHFLYRPGGELAQSETR